MAGTLTLVPDAGSLSGPLAAVLPDTEDPMIPVAHADRNRIAKVRDRLTALRAKCPDASVHRRLARAESDLAAAERALSGSTPNAMQAGAATSAAENVCRQVEEGFERHGSGLTFAD